VTAESVPGGAVDAIPPCWPYLHLSGQSPIRTRQHHGEIGQMPQTSRRPGPRASNAQTELLDPINLRLLAELRDDPRLPMTALGRRVGMSSPAVTERVRRLEEAGVIQGYHLDVDPAALGFPLTAYIRVRPNPGQLPRVAELANASTSRGVEESSSREVVGKTVRRPEMLLAAN
jgi:DNA-binding Lrp family transcriptional regulator